MVAAFCGSGSMVERQLPKLNVAGSSPVFRSKKTHTKRAYKTPLCVFFLCKNALFRLFSGSRPFSAIYAYPDGIYFSFSFRFPVLSWIQRKWFCPSLNEEDGALNKSGRPSAFVLSVVYFFGVQIGRAHV